MWVLVVWFVVFCGFIIFEFVSGNVYLIVICVLLRLFVMYCIFVMWVFIIVTFVEGFVRFIWFWVGVQNFLNKQD